MIVKPVVVREGDAIRFLWPGQRVGIGFDYLRERPEGAQGGLLGEVAIFTLTDADEPGAHLHWARLNLSSTSGRAGLAKLLAERTSDTGKAKDSAFDWDGMIEYACTAAAQMFREGEPFVDLSEMPRPAKLTYLVDKLVPRGQTALLYSKGASGKSLLAMAIAVAVRTGRALPGGLAAQAESGVLYLDYEADEEEQRLRLDYIARGMKLETIPRVICRHQTRPLVADIMRLKGEVVRRGIGLVIVDSIAYALGGNAIDAEVCIEAFTALRSLGNSVSRLVIAHIPKSDKESKTASIFGSIFQENAGRCIWEMQSVEERGGVAIGLYPKKKNWGKKSEPFGLRFTFDDAAESVKLTSYDLRNDSELLGHATVPYQIVALLGDGRERTLKQITEDLGQAENGVKSALRRLEIRGDIHQFNGKPGRGHEATYVLDARRISEDDPF